jgi:hypothetical protein
MPKTQIWSYEELESEELEDRVYYCVMCKGLLDYDKHLDAHVCKSCVQYYDTTNMQDKPLKDVTDFKLVPYGEQRHYNPYDENDPMTAFVENIPLDDLERK